MPCLPPACFAWHRLAWPNGGHAATTEQATARKEEIMQRTRGRGRAHGTCTPRPAGSYSSMSIYAYQTHRPSQASTHRTARHAFALPGWCLSPS
jgi:hypothetical protein